MAREFIDGFESGALDLWDGILVEPSVAVVSTVGLDMDGDYAISCGVFTESEALRKNLTARDEYYFAFQWRPTGTASSGIFGVDLGCDHQFTVWVNSCRLMELRTGREFSDSLLATGTKFINQNTTYLVECYFKIHDSAGIVQLKIDGILELSFNGNTNIVGTTIDVLRIGASDPWPPGRYPRAYFNNIIVDSSAWIGETKIQGLVPTGVGNSAEWTPSVGANWECVDELPASDADYVATNANDITDTYQTEDMSGDIASVKCVQIQARAETEGAPTPTNLKLVARSGGADHLSSSKTVPAMVNSLWHLWEDNPADSAAWEESDVNALEIGVKSAA